MTDPAHDYERHDNDRGAQVRTVIQGLILAGIVGLVGMVIQQGDVRSGAGRWPGRYCANCVIDPARMGHFVHF